MTALRAKLSYIFWEISATWVPLKCLHTNACSRGSKGGVRSLHAVAGFHSHWDQRHGEIAHAAGLLPWRGVGSKIDVLVWPIGRADLYVREQRNAWKFALG